MFRKCFIWSITYKIQIRSSIKKGSRSDPDPAVTNGYRSDPRSLQKDLDPKRIWKDQDHDNTYILFPSLEQDFPSEECGVYRGSKGAHAPGPYIYRIICEAWVRVCRISPPFTWKGVYGSSNTPLFPCPVSIHADSTNFIINLKLCVVWEYIIMDRN